MLIVKKFLIEENMCDLDYLTDDLIFMLSEDKQSMYVSKGDEEVYFSIKIKLDINSVPYMDIKEE